jgi:predicted porin
MKKHLIAAAVEGAFAVPAMAQVTVFGIIDMGYASHKQENQAGSVTAKSSGVQPGNHAGSRIGFRGEEDLGGGLKASFHFEQGFAPNKANGFNVRASGAHPGGAAASGAVATGGVAAGYTAANNRQSWIQLSGGFGSLRAGYLYTTAYNMASLTGLAASEMPGHRQNATNLGGRSEAIQYTSPNIQGFTVAVQMGQGDTNTKSEATTASAVTYRDNQSLNSINVDYSAGPLRVGIDFTQREEQGLGLPATGGTAPTNTAKRKADAMHLGLRYDLGVAQVALVYGDRTQKGTATTTTTTDTTTTALTVFVPLGAAVPFIQYGTTEAETANVKNSDITGTVVGARYNISKRTLAYVMHGTAKDDLVTATTAHKETRTVVGLAHSF